MPAKNIQPAVAIVSHIKRRKALSLDPQLEEGYLLLQILPGAVKGDYKANGSPHITLQLTCF